MVLHADDLLHLLLDTRRIYYISRRNLVSSPVDLRIREIVPDLREIENFAPGYEFFELFLDGVRTFRSVTC